jgi:hypothetical protein
MKRTASAPARKPDAGATTSGRARRRERPCREGDHTAARTQPPWLAAFGARPLGRNHRGSRPPGRRYRGSPRGGRQPRCAGAALAADEGRAARRSRGHQRLLPTELVAAAVSPPTPSSRWGPAARLGPAAQEGEAGGVALAAWCVRP